MASAKAKRRLLIVDGYNIINARKGAVSGPLADARDQLLSELMDYAGYSGQQVILVFDAWMSDRQMRTTDQYGPVQVVYTQKGETADHYIERVCDEHAREVEYGRLEIRVATSDGTEQTIVMGRGAIRLSARELMYEMNEMRSRGKTGSASVAAGKRNPIGDHLPPAVRMKLEEMRRGK